MTLQSPGRRFGWFEDAFTDARYYLRALTHRGNRGFAAVAILTLALGIGSATAIFSVGYGLLSNAFTFQGASEIWSPWITFPPNTSGQPLRLGRNFVTEMEKLPGVAEVMYSTRTLQTSAANNPNLYLESVNGPTGPAGVEIYPSVQMSTNAFSFLGVPPLKGRWIGPQDVAQDGNPAPVVVLSEAAWHKFFPDGSDPIGKTVAFVDSRRQPAPKTVIGVMPTRFGSNIQYEIGETAWLPMPDAKVSPQAAIMQVRPRLRLKPGITREVAEQQMNSQLHELAKANQVQPFWSQQFPASFGTGGIITSAMISAIPMTQREFKATLRDLVSSTFDPQGVLRNNIKYLHIGVGFLLVIACINVANLQLSRAASRTREIAVRLALGAQRIRLIRQFLTESVILAVSGAALGLLVAYGFTKMTVSLMPPNLFGPAMPAVPIGLNGPVLAFAALIAIVSGLLFGLAPAIQSTRPDLNESLKDGGRSGAGSHGGRIRSVLVVAEMAFSIVLLVAASLTIWGYIRLIRVDPGFKPDRLYTAIATGIQLKDPRTDELLAQMRKLPFIEDASRAFAVNNSTPYTLEDIPKDETKFVRTVGADADFLQAYGMTLVRGRNFTADEVAHGDLYALVGWTGGTTLWPAGEDPIGKKIKLDLLAANTPAPAGSAPGTPPTRGEPPTLTVIGVVNNLRPNVTTEPTPFVIYPYSLRAATPINYFAVRLREGQPANLQEELPKLVRAIEPNARLQQVTDLGSNFDQQFQLPRFNFVLFSTLAVIALSLAIAGIYSVLSYHISQRTKEFGVRLALGADRGNILRLVLKGGTLLLGIGVVIGVGASIGLARLVASQTRIFPVKLTDTAAIVVTLIGLVLLCLSAFAACLIPARRATKVDPLVALRSE